MEYPSDRYDGAVSRIAYLDPVTGIGGMNDLPAADINADMAAVADQITGRGFRQGSHGYAVISL